LYENARVSSAMSTAMNVINYYTIDKSHLCFTLVRRHDADGLVANPSTPTVVTWVQL